MHLDPLMRYATPTHFLRSLQDALAQIPTRQHANIRVSLDVAGDSRIGRYHELTNTPNQDRYLIISQPQRLVVAVADGVTQAIIGSGHLASTIAMESFTQTLSEPLTDDMSQEENRLLYAFEHASQAIFDRSMAEPLGRLATDPSDLMSSTALVGLLHGRHLVLGNVGDSRAYLVRHGSVEQLTIDGDLRTLYLSYGCSPEEVLAMGPTAASLYRCLGVTREVERSQLVLDRDRCRPDLARWDLLPGDTLILCTDGLVEEGVFLSASDLPALVQQGSAAEVVQRLIEAACALHRDPSPEEPEGCGDDVTCIVIRVLPSEGAGS
ncbi:MAG: PP2C family serine/threonine-protein phosphatase [Gemmataceae bacterium]